MSNNTPTNPSAISPQFPYVPTSVPGRGTPNFQPSRAYRHFLVRLRLARQEKGVSQRELARRLQVHHSAVQRAENGYRPLDVIEVRAWCRALDIPLVQFTEDLDRALSAAQANDELSPAANAQATSALASLVNEPQSDDAYGDSTDDLPADISPRV